MVGAFIVLLASIFSITGVYAIVSGCRQEWRRRRSIPSADELVLMAEIEEWLKQQQ